MRGVITVLVGHGSRPVLTCVNARLGNLKLQDGSILRRPPPWLYLINRHYINGFEKHSAELNIWVVTVY